MDADERFHPQMKALDCKGNGEWNIANPGQPPKLTVIEQEHVIDQGSHIKNLMTNPANMAIRATRRHWFDFTMKRPTQNWMTNQDHQLRIVRNLPEIGYSVKVLMHEQLIDTRTGKTPVFAHQDPVGGPHFEHFHVAFRTAYPGTKQANEKNYERLSRGEPMLPRT